MRLLFFLLIMSFTRVLYSEQLNVKITSEKAILINADTGKVLYEKGAYESAFPASLTKIATAIYSLNMGKNRLQDIFVATPDAIRRVADEIRAKNNYQDFPPHCLEMR